LDQVALPLVIHGLGGGRDALPSGFLDGTHSCHYRLMPLLFARESPKQNQKGAKRVHAVQTDDLPKTRTKGARYV
jgi:hypothetical protein